MVVFTCGYCGEAVNKPKVEKHYLTKCRNRTPNLSCMDCFKDFHGNDYEPHTKCVSEEQRYSAKGFVPKVNKGEAKQSAWVEMVQGVLEEQSHAPRNVIRIVEEISKHSNTPRKKPKFFNFVKNVCGHRTMPNDIEAAWDLISVKLSALSNINNRNEKQNGVGPQQVKEEISSNGVMNETEQSANLNAGENRGEEMEVEQVKTKKQKKEEKKRKKYEAELQSAAIHPSEDINENVDKVSKKDKKRKKMEQENEANDGDKVRISKKRKNAEQNGDTEANAEISHPTEQMNGEKSMKKKLKLTEEINENCEEIPSLHDQNVVSGEYKKDKGEKFDWHGTIMTLLQKKGNEMPFKRLQKKVLAEYSEATGRAVEDRIVEKLNKKLKGAPNIRIEKNTVILQLVE